ncbi:hypothetical protein DTO013E5_9718 [Penicillium roqueforti]|nr:hypothetical protein DTO013F2_10105 [Penicillium roqueforti]KAI3147983.1 hypothetical protein DTO046C5_10006 [Penicillium roqueforti]KAI3198093.1 hypothetical protein DTO013E5_9718 [Penicillium roqueforti]KAI3223797.1 hypothetical protein DTO012A9_9771 [Penicillium roqueforti]
MQHRLERIDINEYHVMLNDQKDFRSVMAQLGRLSGFGVQMLFRTGTYRSNVAYRMDRIHRSRPGKVIVYTPVVRTGEILASRLGCRVYHSRQVDKATVLDAFQSGQSPVIVATNALGMGVDIPDIRCIIHVRQPRTLIDYAQESGRPGRDGQSSKAMIIQPADTEAPEYITQDTGEDELRRIQQYMEAEHPRCRRYILDGYLDGTVTGEAIAVIMGRLNRCVMGVSPIGRPVKRKWAVRPVTVSRTWEPLTRAASPARRNSVMSRCTIPEKQFPGHADRGDRWHVDMARHDHTKPDISSEQESSPESEKLQSQVGSPPPVPVQVVGRSKPVPPYNDNQAKDRLEGLRSQVRSPSTVDQFGSDSVQHGKRAAIVLV